MSRTLLSNQISTDPNVPEWLDQKYLTNLLSQEIPEFLKINNITTKEECFINPVLRVQVQVQLRTGITRTINYLIKSPELTKTMEPKFPLMANFEKEFFLYDELLPALEQLYKDNKKSIKFSPNAFKINRSKSKQNCLYLDYLQSKNYRALINPNGLERAQVEAVLMKLAAYHAATASYLSTSAGKINLLKKFNKPEMESTKMMSYDALIVRKFHESLYSYGLRCFEDHIKSYQKYAATLDISEDSSDPGSFNVILLGACWPNNLLCHADAFGNIKDMLFVDFQYVKYGPVAYDLFHLLLTMPCISDKVKCFDEYVKLYYEQLIENLKLLKYKQPMPKLTDIQLSLLKLSHYGFEAITKILPLVLSDMQTNDLDDIFANECYAKQLSELLPWLENRGFLEEV